VRLEVGAAAAALGGLGDHKITLEGLDWYGELVLAVDWFWVAKKADVVVVDPTPIGLTLRSSLALR